MDPGDVPAIPTVVLDQDDEPGPPTDLSATKEGEIHFHQQPESPCNKVWAQHTPPAETDYVQTEEKDVYLDVSEVEATVAKPDHKITVRILRRILSIMMVILYKTDTEIANKRKMKSLWDRRPADWPDHVPFKDPNNGVKLQGGGHGQKPVQKELLEMYKFLKHKYKSEVRILTTGKPSTHPIPASIKEEPFTPVTPEPVSPMTPKLEPVASLPQESAGPVVLHEEASSVVPDMSEITPQVIAPDGMDVRVEYVQAIMPPSPSTGGRLPDVLEAQYVRLANYFQQVQNIVDAYNPSAAEDFEKMGKELECLLEETRSHPEKFQLIFNEVGHKVESFLTKVQLLNGPYVSSSMFPKECQDLACEIKKRTNAALNIPSSYQSMHVGMVLDENPPPAIVHTLQAMPQNVASTDEDLMAVVSRRLELPNPVGGGPSDGKKQKMVTKQDLTAALDQQPPKLGMAMLLDSLNLVEQSPASPENSDGDVDCSTRLKMLEMQEEEETATAAAPTTEQMIDDVLGLESAYGHIAPPWSPGSTTSTTTTIQSPDSPRYIGEDPVIVSLHQHSPYSPNTPDIQVINSPSADHTTHIGAEVQDPNFDRGRGGENFIANLSNGSQEVIGVPTTVFSMEVDEDHEDDHLQLMHQGTVEEVYCD